MSRTVSINDFIKSATHTAYHYGFSPIDTLKSHPSCKSCTERIPYTASAQNKKTDALYGLLTSGMCSYFDHKFNGIEGPALFYSIDQVPRSGDCAISLHIVNARKSIGEALLIQTIRSFLHDIGMNEHIVRINSLGDTDSTTRYTRDLTNFLRKRLEEMPPQAREHLKEHPFLALMHLIERNHDLAYKAPSPLEYLTDTSRKHFREIVEYLDMSGTPFEIDPRLIGHSDCYSDALFAFDILDENRIPISESPLTIRGGRYNSFVARTTKTKVPAVGAVLIFKDKKAPTRIPTSRKATPSVYLVQLGFGPKVRSLLLIDSLRKEGISVYQNVMSDSLSEQLRHAERTNARYAIILGHKEYIEDTVILRDLSEQRQENIPVSGLVAALKKRACVAA